MILGDVNTETIIDEVKKLWSNDSHVLLQKGHDFLYDIPYTNSIFKKYNMYNSRIMCLRGKECYTYHKDRTPRIHLPLITNNNCLFILEDRVFSMPSGKAYAIDTRKIHSAMNGNLNFFRYHIVGMTDEYDLF